MSYPIPNLWREEADAGRLYELYLVHLMIQGRHERVVTACQCIRGYAVREPGITESRFTYWQELDALCTLGQFQVAWRRLRRWEPDLFGEKFDLRRSKWPAEMASVLEFTYAPLLYFQGNYRRGCSLLETALDFWYDGRKIRSYDFLYRIDNGDPAPEITQRVTLKHFYDRLGRNLREWRHWEAFVAGLHPRLFRLTEVNPVDLLNDGDHLTPFTRRLLEVQDERTISGVTRGQADLVESASLVERRQQEICEQRERAKVRIAPVRETIEMKLKTLFPELAEISRDATA
jgi:hypothetical protein